MPEDKKEEIKKDASQVQEKEPKIRAITRIYYSNPLVQNAIFKFSANREVVPRYLEAFGKRPDSLQYPSDIINLVNKGATSFHASQEIWHDPLKLNSDMSQEEFNILRKSWDLLIDIDSPYLDLSKIAAKLLISALEHHNIKNYGIKFSGSKGLHIIVSSRAFPEEFHGQQTREMFPDWPRAICQYLISYIRKDYNSQASRILTDFTAIKQRTNISKEDLMERFCTNCNKPATKGLIIKFICDRCKTQLERRNYKITQRQLRCIDPNCPGLLEIIEQRHYYFCENCKDKKNRNLDSEKNSEYFEKHETASADKIAKLDLVLVAPRHLFRMPYSLHEKTALASIVISKEQIDSFSPKDANPLAIKIADFLPNNEPGEAANLLSQALQWKSSQEKDEEKHQKNRYKDYTDMDLSISGVTEDIFPEPIKKLLLGLEDGKKRGLFILLTFLRSLNFQPDYINSRIREWNKLNKPPLKEGYIKSQIEWHLKQKRKILPPNYKNESFYKDIGLLDSKPEAKNPISEVVRRLRRV